jgi:hypoxanthine phosphoribosyltransferase
MSEVIPSEKIKSVYARAQLLHSVPDVQSALVRMSQMIHDDLQDANPLMLCVLVGGVVLAGKLLTLLDFPMQVDYVHATRYRGKIVGSDIHWIATPRVPLENRTILLVDDILDQGITLTHVVDYCLKQGAKEVKTAVLVEKNIERDPLAIQRANYTGVNVPDNYVFGYGMDYKGYLRNAQGIFALAKEDEK